MFDYYRDFEHIVVYLEDMQRDIIENLELFVEHEETQNPFVFFKRLDRRHAMRRYKVNLVVDNSERTGGAGNCGDQPHLYQPVRYH